MTEDEKRRVAEVLTGNPDARIVMVSRIVDTVHYCKPGYMKGVVNLNEWIIDGHSYHAGTDDGVVFIVVEHPS